MPGFSYAEESNFKEESSIRFASDSDFKDDFEFIIVRGMMTKPLVGNPTRPSPRHGRFTLALIKLLESGRQYMNLLLHQSAVWDECRCLLQFDHENMPGYGLKNNGSWSCG